MLKKDKLHQIHKGNRKAINANLFGLGSQMTIKNGIPVIEGFTPSMLETYQAPSFTTQSLDGFKGLDSSMLPQPSSEIGNSVNWGGIGSKVATVASPIITSAIGGGYSTGGIGEGISGIGNAAGDALIDSGVGAPIGIGVKVGSAIVGGLANRAFGTKENTENINTIQQSTENKRNVGNVMGQASTTSDIINLAGQMSGSSGFGTTDLVKGGWFAKGKARRKGQAYIDKENAALAYQNHGLMTGAENVDNIQDDMVMRNFAAFGGPIDMGFMNNMEDMGAIEYGFLSDYLTNKKKQADNKSNTTASMFAGAPSPMFALGGDIQMHGGDYSTGAAHRYSIGEVLDVSEEEANRLKAMGYEFRVIE